MSEPHHALVVARACGIEAGTHVWLLGDVDADTVLVEWKNRQFRVSRAAVRMAPVPAPALDALCALDPCFATPKALVPEHVDGAHYFELLRCTHGRRFLRDTRGGSVMYDRLILVDREMEGQSVEAIWRAYHDLSDDWLNHLGIAS